MMSQSQEQDLQLLLIRLDERTQNIKDDIIEIKESIHTLITDVDSDYVRKVEFEPIRKVVYSVVAFILLAVMGVGVTSIVKPGPTAAAAIKQAASSAGPSTIQR